MSQVHAIKKEWTEITDSDANLHVKVPYFSKVYYVETKDDPSEKWPNPSDADEIKVLISPNHAASFLNVNYKSSGNGPLYMYSTNCDLYVIVESSSSSSSSSSSN